MQKVNLNLLPPPSNVIRTTSITIWQWGWAGFLLDHDILRKLNYDEDRIKDYILDKGEGVYFIIIHDIKNDRYIFLTDRFSCKKIFFYQENDELYFSDFLYKFKTHLNKNFDLDWASIGLYLMYGYVPSNDTLYKGVKSLKPFTYYEYKDNQIRENQYYDIEFKEEKISYVDAVSGTFRLLEQSFLSLTQHHKHFLIPLSGGRDSRFLLALAIKHYSKDQIITFTFGQKGSLEYEIGKGLGKKFGLKSILFPFDDQTYFNAFVYSGTKFKNGLINHSIDAPSKMYEEILGNNKDILVISGYIGDVVLSWSHGKKLIKFNKELLYPETNYFSFEVIKECFSDDVNELISRLERIVCHLYDENGNIVPEKWFYFCRAPHYVNTCLFSEEKLYPFALPFIEKNFYKWITKIPVEYKKKNDFYKDILHVEDFIYSFFRYPLKNYQGVGYDGNGISHILLKTKFIIKAMINRVKRSQNFINFEKAYPEKFLSDQINSIHQFLFLKPLVNKLNRLSFNQKCLLLSLKLNLEYFS